MDDTLNSTCNSTINTNHFQEFHEPDAQQEEPLIISSLLALDLGEEDSEIIALQAQETQENAHNSEQQTQQILAFELELTDLVPESVTPKKDTTRHYLHDKPLNQQKLLDTISYIFLEEDNLEEIDSYTRESQIPLEKPKFAIRKPSASSVGDVSSKVGLASVMFVGGFVAGGACSWAVLSNQEVAAKDKPLNSVRQHPKFAETQIQKTEVKNSISAPEVALPEPSFSPAQTKKAEVKNKTSIPKVVSPKPTLTPENSTSPTVSKASSQAPNHKSELKKPTSQPPKSQALNATTTPLFQQRLLTSADLKGRSAWELTIMRNEIYARHGRMFKEPKLQRHFESQSWYQPRYPGEKFPDSVLSKIELKNAIMIREYQRIHGLMMNL
ncbi:MAG: YARHG domain-containing protein [Chlorogloeopsis fritschii C42_A2020_084]|uniref:YARHG domain-containing protein n=1 Tax=Chlorogloeopsis fritschii TaxID=1124 RepID=UPI0019E76E99|nr:YARHG domain-containing protein [Chlorogloeopsis fritschii]MBF2006209.1 YARHG domain-containing protein [Chlorogloeopsis fritschii C42_A2020_084]